MDKIIIREKLERRKLDEIIPYEKNNKIHEGKGIEAIIHSIKKYGYTDQIEIDENNIILAGHGRLIALQTLGVKKVPCKIIEGLSEPEKKSYRIEHNLTSEISEFDKENLEWELEELDDPYLEALAEPIIEELNDDPQEFDEKEQGKIKNKEIDADDLGGEEKMVMCPSCEFEFVPKKK